MVVVPFAEANVDPAKFAGVFKVGTDVLIGVNEVSIFFEGVEMLGDGLSLLSSSSSVCDLEPLKPGLEVGVRVPVLQQVKGC